MLTQKQMRSDASSKKMTYLLSLSIIRASASASDHTPDKSQRVAVDARACEKGGWHADQAPLSHGGKGGLRLSSGGDERVDGT